MSSLPASIRGGLWMMASALSFTIMTALIRDVAKEIHPFEIGIFRVVTNLLLMLPFVLRTGRAIWVSDNHKVYVFRGLIGSAFLLCYFPGAALIPVSDAQALIFTTPLFAALMAVVFLKEKVRARRVTALIVGFLGALIILRPGFAHINIGSVLVLLSAVFFAASLVTVRHTTRTDHPDTAVFYLMLYMTPLVGIPALFVWTTPTWSQVGLMVLIGFFATLNQRFFSRAFATAETMAVLPYDFSRLPFAAIIGWMAFSELPDVWVWTGGTVIFGASLYIAHREMVAGRDGSKQD